MGPLRNALLLSCPLNPGLIVNGATSPRALRFAVLILSEILRSLRSLRMAGNEGLAKTVVLFARLKRRTTCFFLNPNYQKDV